MKNCSALSTFTSKCVILHCFYSRTTHRFYTVLFCWNLSFKTSLVGANHLHLVALLFNLQSNCSFHNIPTSPGFTKNTVFSRRYTASNASCSDLWICGDTLRSAVRRQDSSWSKEKPGWLRPWDLGPFSNVKRESSTSNHQFSANISVFRGVCDENEWCSLKFHEWWVFQLHSMGFCEMKFWNDTQISGVIYFQNAQEFIWLQFYLANASWVATFHKGNYQKSTATFRDDL